MPSLRRYSRLEAERLRATLAWSAERLRAMLALSTEVTLVAPKSVPRSEGKAVRVVETTRSGPDTAGEPGSGGPGADERRRRSE